MFISSAIAATESTEHTTGVFPPFDPSTFSSQLFWLAVTFGFFYLFMAKAVLPRIGNILEVRRDKISDDLVEAKRLKEETDASITAYEHELAEARQKASNIAREANEKARASAQNERDKVEADLVIKLDEAEAHVADIRAKAMSQVSQIAGDSVEAILAHLIGGKITKNEVTKAISSASK